MIRTNLLPPRREQLRIFGVAVERELIAGALVAAGAVAGVAAVALGLETLAYAQLQRDVADASATVAAHAAVRAHAQHVALDVARYQEFAREMAIVGRSGSESAEAVVRIGNAVPPGVWLDGLVPGDGHVDMTGTATSLEALATTLTALDRTLPGSLATFVHLERRDSDSPDLRFAARLDRR